MTNILSLIKNSYASNMEMKQMMKALMKIPAPIALLKKANSMFLAVISKPAPAAKEKSSHAIATIKVMKRRRISYTLVVSQRDQAESLLKKTGYLFLFKGNVAVTGLDVDVEFCILGLGIQLIFPKPIQLRKGEFIQPDRSITSTYL